MTYLLDTDTIIFLLHGNRAVADRIEAVGDNRIATTAINLAELYFGAFNSTRVEDNLRAVDEFRRVARVFNLDVGAAILFGKIKAALKRERNLLNDSDLYIAAIVLSTQSVLVTNNVRHFHRIEGLILENWVR
ncbi:MAG: PIN domain-containing protein [Nitrospirae bacterium]|nr:PIN domain-containing protein [Nitrospirota bacterium]